VDVYNSSSTIYYSRLSSDRRREADDNVDDMAYHNDRKIPACLNLDFLNECKYDSNGYHPLAVVS
jgi:hypothetical protein